MNIYEYISNRTSSNHPSVICIALRTCIVQDPNIMYCKFDIDLSHIWFDNMIWLLSIYPIEILTLKLVCKFFISVTSWTFYVETSGIAAVLLCWDPTFNFVSSVLQVVTFQQQLLTTALNFNAYYNEILKIWLNWNQRLIHHTMAFVVQIMHKWYAVQNQFSIIKYGRNMLRKRNCDWNKFNIWISWLQNIHCPGGITCKWLTSTHIHQHNKLQI